ncbi:MAG: hypothetical protein QG608_1190 [Actinomycetota bacterium]|nr:hypothetical protein [Actinomycetota bacterium]
MRRILFPVALLATALALGSTAACSSDSTPDRSLGARPHTGAAPDPRNLKEFTAIFRANHPKLAQDRPESEIEKAIAEICMAQTTGPVSLQQLQAAFTNDDVVPDQTTITEIMKLAGMTACAPPKSGSPGGKSVAPEESENGSEETAEPDRS